MKSIPAVHRNPFRAPESNRPMRTRVAESTLPVKRWRLLQATLFAICMCFHLFLYVPLFFLVAAWAEGRLFPEPLFQAAVFMSLTTAVTTSGFLLLCIAFRRVQAGLSATALCGAACSWFLWLASTIP